MLKKKLLEVGLDFDFKLLAITAQLRDYRLCHIINKYTESDFEKSDDLVISFKNTGTKYYSCYTYFPDNVECYFTLLSNRGTDGLLIPEMKEIDFFIIIKEFIDDEDFDLFFAQLKQIPEIQAVAELNPNKLKSKENLIF
ncbi:hypothetical protein BCY91_11785 [Pelobium manganitolerans]|uniref:IPExxxVDY family protein n=1 Tax=Pelobium manganitolerans TaxID=1842495 RepID=A0A419S200_9SPHI|nr:IPExxxVDY family protein [Pelobium manganitolerans]RKD12511.1 hypothetical protein BCY91_11785 [Pelobium manganitolerans]